MAKNGISYEGRIVNTDRIPIEFGKFSENGITVLKLTVAEQHSMKNGKAPKEYQDNSKASDAYVNTTTSWHKVTVFGDKAEALASEWWMNHGAIIAVTDASYVEEAPFTTRDNVQRAGRPESIGDLNGSIEVKKKNDGTVLGPREDLPAIWDGAADIPIIKGSGGGRAEFVVRDDEGF